MHITDLNIHNLFNIYIVDNTEKWITADTTAAELERATEFAIYDKYPDAGDFGISTKRRKWRNKLPDNSRKISQPLHDLLLWSTFNKSLYSKETYTLLESKLISAVSIDKKNA